VAEREKQDFLGPAKRQQDEDLIRELVLDEDEVGIADRSGSTLARLSCWRCAGAQSRLYGA
jgi:hypothetical protein